jgi:hypothetical protein
MTDPRVSVVIPAHVVRRDGVRAAGVGAAVELAGPREDRPLDAPSEGALA